MKSCFFKFISVCRRPGNPKEEMKATTSALLLTLALYTNAFSVRTPALVSIISLREHAKGARSSFLHMTRWRSWVSSGSIDSTMKRKVPRLASTVVARGSRDDGVSTPVIQWYPGHIAKAEKQLVDCLQRVDVVVELRDARIPEATAHPLVEEWVGKKRPRVVVFARKDMVAPAALSEWQRYLIGFADEIDFVVEQKQHKEHLKALASSLLDEE